MFAVLENVLAPGYKGRAKFLFFTEQCKVRKKSLPEFEQQLSPLLIGESLSRCYYYHHHYQQPLIAVDAVSVYN